MIEDNLKGLLWLGGHHCHRGADRQHAYYIQWYSRADAGWSWTWLPPIAKKLTRFCTNPSRHSCFIIMGDSMTSQHQILAVWASEIRGFRLQFFYLAGPQETFERTREQRAKHGKTVGQWQQGLSRFHNTTQRSCKWGPVRAREIYYYWMKLCDHDRARSHEEKRRIQWRWFHHEQKWTVQYWSLISHR